MSRSGMVIANQYAHDLPKFLNHSEAVKVLLSQRDMGLEEIHTIAEIGEALDFSLNSLKLLEKWFFETGRPAATPSGYSMQHAIGFYFGEVLCRSAKFSWVVQEYAFEKSCYEIGVQRFPLTIMLTKGKVLSTAGNKLMQCLFRDAKRYS